MLFRPAESVTPKLLSAPIPSAAISPFSRLFSAHSASLRLALLSFLFFLFSVPSAPSALNQPSNSSTIYPFAAKASSSPQTTTPAKLTKQAFLQKLSTAAIERTTHAVHYDPAYVRIPYPNGDVPADTGVCTDEIIRSYRALGLDLQKEVHEDMQQNFAVYHTHWGLNHTDSNIDHRRVPNLMVFFSRKGESLALSNRAEDYSPGDLVTWDLGGSVPHIGIVVDRKSSSTNRYMVVHNIGRGPKLEDVLFNWKITGHYRYYGNLTN